MKVWENERANKKCVGPESKSSRNLNCLRITGSGRTEWCPGEAVGPALCKVDVKAQRVKEKNTPCPPLFCSLISCACFHWSNPIRSQLAKQQGMCCPQGSASCSDTVWLPRAQIGSAAEGGHRHRCSVYAMGQRMPVKEWSFFLNLFLPQGRGS